MREHHKPTTNPFLKWAGGKRKQVSYLARKLPAGDRLVEPFVGAGALFMGTDYESYLLADSNKDLINLYHTIKYYGPGFISHAAALFSPSENNRERYYYHRDRFNRITEPTERAALFLYLNRHGYNGLCRYNLKGEFNVPFGAYKQPYYPMNELISFYRKTREKDVTFACQDYQTTFNQVRDGDVIYCDPPYIKLSNTADFTAYTGRPFAMTEHITLHALCVQEAADGRPVVLNNHSHPVLNKKYRLSKASLAFKRRGRSINSNTGKRKGVVEVTASWNFWQAERRAAA
ncbi:MAG: Dam family site-specific DNA-(adenine-N6)-methyltransferase [Gammaproteobacteria bacterium]|nr:Dam family site-specific DNA-(adenine-N6)-methyltransferase [Gammaproteobacteria bacterium]